MSGDELATTTGLEVGQELDVRVDTLRKLYADVKNAIEALPASRMRALAVTDLESSFTRAVFAVAEMHDPISSPPIVA